MRCGKFGGLNDNMNNKIHSISFKKRYIIAFSLQNRTLFFQAIKRKVCKKVNKEE